MIQTLTDRSVVPPGGFRYLQTDTEVWVRGASFVELVQNVKKHRTANNLPFGAELDREIEGQLCAGMPPGICKCGDENEKRRASLVKRPTWEKFKEGTRAVTAALIDGKAPQGEADMHSMVCAKCPFNQPPEQGCTSCKASELANLLAGFALRATVKDGSLKACLLCGCGLKAKVHLKRETAAKLATDGRYFDLLPEWCWIRGPKEL